ncbi:uncharacterized protein FIBRA_08394 [Fibroporia radiculosa]|uniref:Uncharacterized protein n=1 Tax=Fibroporia radiculosa TaxID=599839 RepID=J4H554_9APHY|nr:uncharacterized protein FIBRA_08394 [Fibroporia radiculosa]CCM06144.1 predicted protein [Fibroporia radiculosa]
MSQVSSPLISAKIFDASIGALLVGVVFQAISYGALCLMAWKYFRRPVTDSNIFRVTIFLLWWGFSAQKAFCLATDLHALYYFTITNFFNPYGLLRVPWSVCLLGVEMGLVITIVRITFSNRLRRFYKARGELDGWRLAPLCLVVFVSIGNFGTSFAFFSRKEDEQNSRRLALSIATSVKMFVSPNQTDLFKLKFVASPRTLLYVPFYIQIANYYLISLVASLNYRELIRSQLQRPLSLDFSAFDRCAPARPTAALTSQSIACASTPTSSAQSSDRMQKWKSEKEIVQHDMILVPECEKMVARNGAGVMDMSNVENKATWRAYPELSDDRGLADVTDIERQDAE